MDPTDMVVSNSNDYHDNKTSHDVSGDPEPVCGLGDPEGRSPEGPESPVPTSNGLGSEGVPPVKGGDIVESRTDANLPQNSPSDPLQPAEPTPDGPKTATAKVESHPKDLASEGSHSSQPEPKGVETSLDEPTSSVQDSAVQDECDPGHMAGPEGQGHSDVGKISVSDTASDSEKVTTEIEVNRKINDTKVTSASDIVDNDGIDDKKDIVDSKETKNNPSESTEVIHQSELTTGVHQSEEAETVQSESLKHVIQSESSEMKTRHSSSENVGAAQGAQDVSFEHPEDEFLEDEEEDLMDLSLRIAQKSQDNSRLYRLVKVVDAGEDVEDYKHDIDFMPPEIEEISPEDTADESSEDVAPGEEIGGDTEEGGEENDEKNADGEDKADDTSEERRSGEPCDTENGNQTDKLCNKQDTNDNDNQNPNADTPDKTPTNGATSVDASLADSTSVTRTQISIKSDKASKTPTGISPDTMLPSGGKKGRVRAAEFRRSNSWKKRTGYARQSSQEYNQWGYVDAMEDEEENFVLSALFRAVEEGNLDAVTELLGEAQNFNINQCNKQGETLLHTAASNGHIEIMTLLREKGVKVNATDKHGDSAVYWAARQGHLEVIKYLKDNGVNLDTQNKAGEAPIHVAARYGHTHILEFLCNIGADVNLQDKLGETALHTVAWHGLSSDVCSLLCASGCKVDTRNKENETPLHCAASRGNLECVRILLSHEASLNVQDKRLNTPLHLACRRRYVPIALLMLHAGCAFDMSDCINETPLHPACKEGLLPVVQTMCAYGCQIDVVNKGGLSPLHLAARCGHTEVVRCLLLSGAEPELPNKDGVSAEIMALAQGHQEVAELLAKLKPERREMCIKQLIPTNQTLSRIKVKVFGSSGVGKTTLINSLKCGYLSSFFRKARLNSSASASHSSDKTKVKENGCVTRHNSLPTQLSYDVVHDGYTRGIDVQQVTVSGGAGDLSVWEFSGYEPYYVMYDHFIGDPNCVHIVVFNLQDQQDVQLSQILFWLTFIKSRIAPMEPVGPGGRLPWPARVMLVATHADKVECTKTANGELECSDALILLATVKQKFEADLYIQNQIYVMDAHLAMSQDVKALRTKLGEMKSQIVQFLPCSNGFLDATVSALSTWKKVLSDYPVVSWPVFIDYVRSKVNLLASEEHLKELMCQLQLLGEVIYIETENEQDLVVLHPKWLTCDVIGHLLSHDQLKHSRPTGCFSIDDFQLVCPETDAKDMLVILEALELCTRCEVDGEVEYEFPCLNFVEMIPGLWEKDDSRIPDPVYGGVRIHCPRGMTNQLLHMFPRVQIHLRRDILSEHSRLDADLYQWYHGSKFCSGTMECLITLAQSEQVIEIKCRAPDEMRTNLYYFQEDVCDIVLDVIEDSCPGICLEKYILSCTQLKAHKNSVYAYTPKDILSAQLDGRTSVALDSSTNEEFINLIGFGSDEIWNNITPGIDLHCHYLSIHARRRLSMVLDPPDPMGRDWCLLAVCLGLTEDLPKVDQGDNQILRSKTDSIIDMWCRDTNSSIASLIRKLKELGRQDAADALLTVSPLYHVFQDGDSQEDKTNAQPLSYSSENTLSSSNLSR